MIPAIPNDLIPTRDEPSRENGAPVMTFGAIAREMGLSRTTVQAIYDTAMDKLRAEFAARGLGEPV